MDIRIYPTKFEIVDEDTKDPLATVEAADETAAHVMVHSVVNARCWTPLAGAIQSALHAMRLTGDDE